MIDDDVVIHSPENAAPLVDKQHPHSTTRRDTVVSNMPVSPDTTAVGAVETSLSISEFSGTDRSPYLVKRLIETDEVNLFNHVKFHSVKKEVDRLRLPLPNILDIGCGTQIAHRYLSRLDLEHNYFGVDYEPRFNPDAIFDLMEMQFDILNPPWKPDVVLLLDVLEHLFEDIDDLDITLERLQRYCPQSCTVIFTLPQMYRLDRFKLKHLHYPEHKIRLTQQEWTHLISSHFAIRSVRGFGFLSVIPYLPMASKQYRPDNHLGRVFNYLRGTAFEWGPLKPADLWLSRLFGNVPGIKTLSNDIIVVAEPKRQ